MPRGCDIPVGVRRQVGREYAKGTPIRRIMDKYGVSKGSIYNIARGRRGPSPYKITPAKQDQLATMNYRGHSDQEIADALGVARSSVTEWRHQLGLPTVPAKQRKRNAKW